MRLLVIFCLAISLSLFAFQTKAQPIKLLKLDQLEKRIELGKDTLYIVNFWATWCLPCLEELPHFEKLKVKVAGQKVKILLVSLDFKSKLKSDVTAIVKKLKLKNEVFLLDEASQQNYIDRISKDWSGALPATLFINKQKNRRSFFEQEFTYNELLASYNINK
ncbi:TlpA disulfide reductase family protein [Pedobacter duraquae]|uniref:AhpC/TSA family protein n=1 Tax=Pedobacter duraquae TaxID=425511 RepID=A0A4V3C3P2_9SPHI|nr:TlpA disulfide reductase family protein [Pedobacter duraquae]TDO22818.1 AhpC/TSA family protein [Pedobacter duraquae]